MSLFEISVDTLSLPVPTYKRQMKKGLSVLLMHEEILQDVSLLSLTSECRLHYTQLFTKVLLKELFIKVLFSDIHRA